MIRAVLALAAAGLAGCVRPPSSAEPGPVITYRQMRPDAPPPVDERLVLAGTDVPIKVRRLIQGRSMTLELWAHGEVLQREVYRSTPSAFGLVRAGGETYSPALDLLRFPMRVGDRWNWTGTVTYGVPRKAQAVVTTSPERLYLADAPRETVRVTVDRSFAEAEPAAQRLVFWFEPNGGVLQREFGPADRREPVAKE